MFLISLILFFLFPKNVFATGEFNVSQKIQYQINSNGDATVSQQIELINNFSQIYPKEYQITLSSGNIKNITGSDDQGDIIKKIDQQNESTTISLLFNQANVGKGQITKFRLNYDLPSLAISKGNTWEIALPENQTTDTQPQIETDIFIPTSFGSLSFASVSPQNTISLNNQTEIHFKNNPKNQKILLIFGDYQLFDFKLKYFLENTNNKATKFQIAIPPETDIQKVIYRSIEPPPQNIDIDNDGNYLANYLLQANEVLDIIVDGQAKILHSNSSQDQINSSIYLKKDTYWEIDDPDLISIANSLKTPKDIYNYVVNHLSYKTNTFDGSVRQGASLAFKSPNDSLCTEFTDLFITLARIKGIPAREVQGFAYSNNIKIKPINLNTDVLHAWPQYYDNSRKTWISIDPTWGKTTNGIDYFNDLDPNHFAFVFHGINSQYPLPPGAYKNNQDIKTVTVEFAKSEFTTDQIPLKIKPTSQKFYQSSKIEIINPNYHSISHLKVSIKNLNFEKEIDHIPPLSSIKIDIPNVSLFKSVLPQNYQFDVNLRYNSDTVNFKINNHRYWFYLVVLGSSVATLIGFGGIISKTIKKQK